MNPKTESVPQTEARKPRLSLFFATACYAGYLPKGPGTWGSLVGAFLYFLCSILPGRFALDIHHHGTHYVVGGASSIAAIVALATAVIGLWTSHRVASYTAMADPQFVVIDEVSGQFFTYLIALAPANWKYLLLGLILFRVFDIWKPFPARQAESLPGGWGIMADDWIAAIYAAIGIWIASALGL
jgi:phosphatidylglycerophosphatase A